jgi:FlaA1/EpsC-like NDP-sugar epimerase
MLTGAAGTVGKEVVQQLLSYGPAEIRLVDNNEAELFLMGEHYRSSNRVIAFLGDVRDAAKMMNLSAGVDIIFHIAAFKHVVLSEYNPFEAVQTNIIGVKNVIQGALQQRVSQVIFTSSDKAVNPTNVMGTTKLMGERLMTAANIVNLNGYQTFTSVRFGNIIGSSGSVVPIFADQIRRGGPVTVTDKRMTRFFMTAAEAARFVIESGTLACGGEVFVTKMPVMRIEDLAKAMIELMAPACGYDPNAIQIEYIGSKPGEKLYEELITAEEVPRSLELPRLFVILPALRSFYQIINYRYKNNKNKRIKTRPTNRPYISMEQEPLTLAETMDYLVKHKVIEQVSRISLTSTLSTGPS